MEIRLATEVIGRVKEKHLSVMDRVGTRGYGQCSQLFRSFVKYLGKIRDMAENYEGMEKVGIKCYCEDRDWHWDISLRSAGIPDEKNPFGRLFREGFVRNSQTRDIEQIAI